MEQLSYTSVATQQQEQEFFAIWGQQLGKIAIVVSDAVLDKALLKNRKLHAILGQSRQQVTIFTLPSCLLPSLELMQANQRLWLNYWSARQEPLRQNLRAPLQRYHFSEKAFRPFFQLLSAPPPPESIGTLLQHQAFKTLTQEVIKNVEGRWYIQTVIQVEQKHAASLFASVKKSLPQTLIIDRRQIIKSIDALLAKQTQWLAVAAALFIFILFSAYFIHLELSFAGLAPLILAVLWILGYMAYAGIYLNVFNTLVIIFVLGLGIDYSAFRIASYLNISNDSSFDLAARSAIILSAVTTLLGFGSLVFADHPALHSLGVCVVIGMAMVLFNNLFLLPILLRFFIPPGRQSHPIHFYHIISSLWAFGFFISFIVVFSALVFPVIALYQLACRKPRPQVYLRMMEIANYFLLATNPLVRFACTTSRPGTK